MADRIRLVASIVSQNGTCNAGHKVGDEFDVSGATPSGMCPFAFYTIFPFLVTLQYGGSFPWEEEPDKSSVACPDPANPVVFELTRISEEREVLV